MHFSEDVHDIGTILLTVIATVVLGSILYAYNSRVFWRQLTFQPLNERCPPSCQASHGSNLFRDAYRMAVSADHLRPRRETRRVARLLAAVFGGLFLIIFALLAAAS